MLRYFKQRFADVGTIKALCEGAERHALAQHQRTPGAEHFLLAALELPDGSAVRALARLGADAAAVRAAIGRQYEQALESVGVFTANLTSDSARQAPPAGGIYQAMPSGDQVMQALAQRDKSGPLQGAHVLQAVAALRHGVVPRTLRQLGLEPQQVACAAAEEIQASLKRQS